MCKNLEKQAPLPGNFLGQIRNNTVLLYSKNCYAALGWEVIMTTKTIFVDLPIIKILLLRFDCSIYANLIGCRI